MPTLLSSLLPNNYFRRTSTSLHECKNFEARGLVWFWHEPLDALTAPCAPAGQIKYRCALRLAPFCSLTQRMEEQWCVQMRA
eukprot:1162987-Amphidinium_carterae.1